MEKEERRQKRIRNRINSLLFSGFGAFAIVRDMEGKITDNTIKIRDKTLEDINKEIDKLIIIK